MVGRAVPKVREVAFSGKTGLDIALIKLAVWFPPLENAIVWGNGANFDNAMVAAAYRAIKHDVPCTTGTTAATGRLSRCFSKTVSSV
jgi:hypothetical protein